MSDVFVREITQDTAEAITEKRKIIKEQSRKSAEAGLRLVEVLANAIVEVQIGQKANNELVTILDREAKKHGRRYTDIVDLDVPNKAVTYRQKGAKVAEVDAEGSG